MRKRRTSRAWLLLGLLAGIAVAADAWRQLATPLPLEHEMVVEVPRGANLRAVLASWQGSGLLGSARQARYLAWHARLTGRDTAIKPGEYALQPGMRALDLTALLVSGRGVLHELRIIEGWRFQDMLAAVLADPRLEHVQPQLTEAALMQALGHPDLAAEGRFFPDTYRFPRHTSDLALMRQAFAAQKQILETEWERRDREIPLSNSSEALILASIVERETGLASERAQIAGVFTRRLRLGMRLQTDPTVIYGMGAAFDGNLRRRDLVQDTPFNTYTRKGLPPTPICLPGRDAIRAALHPAPGETLYFVSRGDGSHQFSVTIEDHNAAVRKYQLRRKPS